LPLSRVAVPRALPAVQRVSPNGWDAKTRAMVNGLVLGKNPWPLYLWSQATGTGKTTLGLVLIDLANAALRNDESFTDPEIAAVMMGFIDYAQFPRVLKRLEKQRVEMRFGTDTATLTRATITKRLAALPLVVVDDVCEVPKASRGYGEAHEIELKTILDSRGRRPVIVTSNLSPWLAECETEPQLTKVVDSGSPSDRLSDRLTCGTVYEMPGQSRRRA